MYSINYKLERGHLNSPIFTEEQIEYIVSNYENHQNVSALSLSKEFETSPQTIKKVLESNNVSLKNRKYYRQTYSIDESFFDNIDTEEKAYWLGFLYADGVINEERGLFRINLKKDDENHLDKFKQSLNSNHLLKDTNKKTNNKTYYGIYISIVSKHIVKQLVGKGCFQNKSLNLLFPHENIVPEYLIHHFIRGYFDGDGCLTFTTRKGKTRKNRNYTIKFLGTENFLENIQYFLESNNKLFYHNGGKYCSLEMGGNKQCKRIYDYLYKEANIYLDRKYEKFKDMLYYIENKNNEAWNKGLTYTITNNTANLYD